MSSEFGFEAGSFAFFYSVSVLLFLNHWEDSGMSLPSHTTLLRPLLFAR